MARKNVMQYGVSHRGMRFLSPVMAPEGEGDSGGGGSNGGGQGGNGGQGGENGGEGQNNASNGFNPAQFWTEPAPKKDGESSASSQNQDAGAQFATQFQQQLQNFKVPAVFNDQILTDLANGNHDGANQAISAAIQNATQQAVLMSANLMKQVISGLRSEMAGQTQNALTERDNQDALLKHFPSAADAAVRPTIESVFKTSLKHCNGDREKAIAMTKEMLQHVGKTAAADFGLNNPPPGASDNLMTPAASNLVKDLLSM